MGALRNSRQAPALTARKGRFTFEQNKMPYATTNAAVLARIDTLIFECETVLIRFTALRGRAHWPDYESRFAVPARMASAYVELVGRRRLNKAQRALLAQYVKRWQAVQRRALAAAAPPL